MLLEVESCGNFPDSISQMYHVISTPRKIHSIHYEKDGEEINVSIIGWDAETETPCPVYICQIEESGDGVALLIFGGNGGIRMKSLADDSPWDVNDPNQWSESHLVYPRESKVSYLD